MKIKLEGSGILAACFLLFFLFPSAAQSQAPEIQWWYDIHAPSFGSAAAGDIDKDGKLEIVFGTYFGDEHVYALNGEDGTLLWDYNTGGCNDASPVIADVDLDGDLEVIVAASSPCNVLCFNGATGAVEWQKSTYPNCIDSPPAVADVDADGKPEVIFGAFNGYVYCLNGEDGSQHWRVNVGAGSYIQTCPNILDLNGDGKLDIVVAQYSGTCRVYGLKGEDGSTLWYSDAPTDWMYHGGSVADIDGDGKAEIAIGCYDGKVYVLNSEDGSLHWQYSAPYYIGAPTSIADLNNDDEFEILYCSWLRVGALRHTGSSLWTYNAGDGMFRGAAISDVNGDGTLDVAFGCDDGILRVLHGNNGSLLWSYNLQTHYGDTFQMDHAPVIADFDNDGKLDIFIVGGYGTSTNPSLNHGRAYLLSAGDGTGPGWMTFRHDNRRGACFDDPWVNLRKGNVDMANGAPADVLFMNGSAGDEWRVVTVEHGEDLVGTIAVPPTGPVSASYALYVQAGEATLGDPAVQPYNVGTSCFSLPPSNGTPAPPPYTVANNIGYRWLLGVPFFPAAPPAPATIFTYPYLLEGAYTFQGIIYDNGTTSSEVPISLTNAVVVKVVN